MVINLIYLQPEILKNGFWVCAVFSHWKWSQCSLLAISSTTFNVCIKLNSCFALCLIMFNPCCVFFSTFFSMLTFCFHLFYLAVTYTQEIHWTYYKTKTANLDFLFLPSWWPTAQSAMWLLFSSDQILFQREPALCFSLSTVAAAGLWELFHS